MAECFKCGASSDQVRLFDVISKEGVVKICDNCWKEEELPVLKRPTSFQLKEAESPSSVYERLSSIAGVDAEEHRKKFGVPSKQEEELKEQETTLKEIVDKHYQKKIEGEEPEHKPDLIDNFHWIIMRVRRMRKLTQEQLAREIGESKTAIEMAEKGILPDDYQKIVNKLEAFLGIRIKKRQAIVEREEPRLSQVRSTLSKLGQTTELKFDRDATKSLTIADLKEIKAEQNTKTMHDEIKEDISLNEEAKKALEERKGED